MFQWRALGSVLVSVNLDEPSYEPLRVASESGAREIHVVYVLPDLEPSLMAQIDAAHRLENAQASLMQWIAGSPAPQARPHVRIGLPSQVIPEVAVDLGADLLILESHGRTGLRRAVMGSVAERMVRFSPCPVLVVKAGAS